MIDLWVSVEAFVGVAANSLASRGLRWKELLVCSQHTCEARLALRNACYTQLAVLEIGSEGELRARSALRIARSLDAIAEVAAELVSAVPSEQDHDQRISARMNALLKLIVSSIRTIRMRATADSVGAPEARFAHQLVSARDRLHDAIVEWTRSHPREKSSITILFQAERELEGIESITRELAEEVNKHWRVSAAEAAAWVRR